MKALANLGVCHEIGLGVTQNYQEARRLYTLASAEEVDDLNRLEEKIRAECPFLDKQVVITGTSHKDRNGRAGTATSFNHALSRYVVRLECGRDSRTLKPKAENLARYTSRKERKKGECDEDGCHT